MTKKILIVDELYRDILDDLKDNGFEVDYRPEIDRSGIKEIIGVYQGIIIRSKTNLDEEILKTAGKIRFIARAGAGVDNIDESYCRLKGITVINAPEGNRDALGEHALGLLLCLLNKIHIAGREVREGIWNREGNRGIEIQGKTVGIIGYGNMGSSFARKLAGLNCTVLAYDKYKKDFSDEYAKETSLEMLYKHTDILSFHVPLTNETFGLYDESFFQKFEKNIYVVNTARGPILPVKDLLNLLNAGKIMGACLDVLENEKMDSFTVSERDQFNRLMSLPNVVVTPHVGGWSYESYQKINDILVEKIGKLNLSGEGVSNSNERKNKEIF